MIRYERLPFALQKTNQTGHHGVTILRGRVEREGWIFPRQDGDSDFDVVGEIAVVRKRSVIGHCLLSDGDAGKPDIQLAASSGQTKPSRSAGRMPAWGR